MSVIPTARVQEVWEQALGQPLLQRALLLLWLAGPSERLETLATLTLGERDRRLLDIRERLSGSHFEAVADCPQCGERLELSFTADQLRAPPARAEVTIDHEGFSVHARLPTTADLMLLADSASGDSASLLLMRCRLRVKRDGAELPLDSALPEQVVEALQQGMADADPMMDLRIALSCPACTHAWSRPFDIAAFLWHEVDDRAKRLLQDTHALARAYGWSEADILAMSDVRRQRYLELVGAS